MAYAVRRRTQELGIRTALGARKRQVVALVMGESLVAVSFGVVIGIAAAVAFSHTMNSLLFGVQPTDPGILATTAVALALVTVLASIAPARHAAHVDPVIALRSD